MRRKIKYSIIKNQNENLKILINELNTQEKSLLKNIESIGNCYKGKDADIIVSKFNDTYNSLKIYSLNMENYIKYFDSLSGHYRDTHERSIMKMNSTSILNRIDNMHLDSLSNVILSSDAIKKGLKK